MTHSDCAGDTSPEMSGDRDSSLIQQNGVGEVALRKGPWTKEEDEILLKFVKEKGIVKWTSIGKQTGLARSGKSCRLRWLNHLRPNLKKGSFTKEEENLIVRLHSQYGNKWTRIASKLPGRTDNEIKNFWNTRVKKCQKRQLPLYPETNMEGDRSLVVDANYDYTPGFYINNVDKKFTTKTDFDQILQSSTNGPSETCVSSLHRFSSVTPHSWSLQQLLSPAYRPTQSFHSPSFESSSEQHPLSQPLQAPSIAHHFPTQNQSIPTNQPTQFFVQPPSSPGYISSLQQSRPSYQSMHALFSSPAVPSPTWLSSLQKDNGSSLAKQSSISHSTHSPIKPLMCASTPHRYSFMPSLENKQFSRFKRPGGRLPRPLSAPLMSSTPASEEPFGFTFELNSSNHYSSVSTLNMNPTQTSTTPTYQLNFPTVGLSDSSLEESLLSVDMTWPSISQSLNESISPSSSFISKMEPPSIQSFSAAALKYPSDTSLSQLNTQSMASFNLLDAQLQEELTIRDWQSSRKDEFFRQNLTRESLPAECIKTEDSLVNFLSKENLPNKISQTELLLDKYSIEDILTQSNKTTNSSGNSLNTENSSCKSRRKEFMNISKEKNGIRTQVTRKEDKFNESSKPTYFQDSSSRTDDTITEKLEGILAGESSEREVLPTRLDVNKATLTEGSKNYDLLVEETRRKDYLDTGLTEDCSSERSDFTESLKMEDSLVIESFTVGGEFEQELKKDMLEEGSRREGLLIERSSKDELVIGESSCKGDQLIKLSKRHDVTDASMSKDIFLKENSGKESLLTSSEQYPVVDEADLASSQVNALFLPESGGWNINSSSVKHSAERIEAEDHIDTEISSLLEFFPMAAEIPEWYNTSQEISSNKTAL